MKEIPLSQGKFALVDDEDFEELSKYHWYALKDKNKFYSQIMIRKDGKRICVKMHRFILNAKKGMQVDHIDGNGLNNQRFNLRICTNYENSLNRGKQKNNTSGYKGVNLDKRRNAWNAGIRINGKYKYIGYFKNKEEAYEAYCNYCKKYHGSFANLG